MSGDVWALILKRWELQYMKLVTLIDQINFEETFQIVGLGCGTTLDFKFEM
jgi:ABC-type enterochelin transport system permease subunit